MPQPTKDNQSLNRQCDQEVRRAHLQQLADEPILKGTLTQHLSRHSQIEIASFHTPGHKGRERFHLPGLPSILEFASEFDVTELDGLDDLSYPYGVLERLESRIAELYQAKDSVISVQGASGGLLAAILAVAKRGTDLLVPRNAHRSVVHALVLSGLEPVWYEPRWNAEWGLWESVDACDLADAVARFQRELGGDRVLAGVLVVSPTFAGAVSDIGAIAQVAHQFDLPLIVDEAQGSHFLPSTCMPKSATVSGADLVVHSFHKTLGALTQTGAVQVSKQRYVEGADVRAALRLVSTSSPNYLLLASIEQAILVHQSQDGAKRMEEVVRLADRLRASARRSCFVYQPAGGCDPLHVLIGSPQMTGDELLCKFKSRGVFCETVLGAGCLLLLGSGTQPSDIDLAEDLLKELPSLTAVERMPSREKPQPLEQILSPRQAFFAPSELVNSNRAAGRIAADCLAPCPPGVPVCVPGAMVGADINDYNLRGMLRVLLNVD